MKRIVWTKQEALDRLLEGDLVYYYADENSFIPEDTGGRYYRKDENGDMIRMNRIYTKSIGKYVMIKSPQELKLMDRNLMFYSLLISEGSVFAAELEKDTSIKTIGEY